MNLAPQASNHGQFRPVLGNVLKQLACTLLARLQQKMELNGNTILAEVAYDRRPRIMSDIL